MPKIKQITVYDFDELSDRAKERARDWYREGMEVEEYAEHIIEEAQRIGAMIGIELDTRTVKLMGGGTRQEPIVYWQLHTQGSGVSYSARYRYRKGGARELAKYAPPQPSDTGRATNTEINRIARELQDIQRHNGYQLIAGVRPLRDVMQIEVCDKYGYELVTDETAAMAELLRDFANWIYHSLELEYEYQTSAEVIDESIRANEYTFDEEGRRA